jgi:hypothetical protein
MHQDGAERAIGPTISCHCLTRRIDLSRTNGPPLAHARPCAGHPRLYTYGCAEEVDGESGRDGSTNRDDEEAFGRQLYVKQSCGEHQSALADGKTKSGGERTSAASVRVPHWPAPGSEDTELGVFMGPEVSHGEAKIYAGVQA